MRHTQRVLTLGILSVVAAICFWNSSARGDDRWVVFEGKDGPGKGKHIVFVTGDEEYRSEESMPQLAKILAVRHGFKCTVLFAINRQTGEIDPLTLDNIPGLEALETADLMVMFTRFRELPDEQMKHIIDYTNSGKPIVGLRTSTHAFHYSKHKDSPYAKYSFNSREPGGGYGRQVLGETWINHYGDHQKESTRGAIAPGMENHPIVRGCDDIWGPSDVYGLTTLTGDCKPVILGQVLKGMNPTDEPNTDKKPVPVAWTKTYTGEPGEGRPGLHDHDGPRRRPEERRLPPPAGQRLLLGHGHGRQDPGQGNVDLVGQYKPEQDRLRQVPAGLEAGGS